MANILRKNLYLCFSKIKCLPTTLSPPLTNDDDEEEEEDDDNLSQINPTATNSSSFLLKTFNSLYNINRHDVTSEYSKSLPASSTDQDLLSSASSSDHDYNSDHDFIYTDFIPDFSTVFASRRFFFSSPGNSNSIIESPESSAAVVSGGVAIQTYSPNPYDDFRRSMQEMVEAQGLTRDVKADWDFLHELLLCYLNLNPKHTHKFIFRAFTDVIVSFMPSTTPIHSSRRTDGHRRCPSSQPPLVL